MINRLATFCFIQFFLFFSSPAAAEKVTPQGPSVDPPSLSAGSANVGLGLPPVVKIRKLSSISVVLYEKLEIELDLQEANFSNPYDPEQIDVSAVFTSPAGQTRRIWGFYDNYRNVAVWKIRFAPDEIGLWQVQAAAQDIDGIGLSSVQSFTAVAGAQHGWVHVSERNPHYLQHSDGAPFYGYGAYSPWGTSTARLDLLAKHKANFFAIWNINYGSGEFDGPGLLENELGKYNQPKCGAYDKMFEAAEARQLYIMLCIWPHDLFSNTVWAHQWHNNPYRTICDVKDVYKDELCWEYQKKFYRYLIARYGYSRSLAVWEIMNEMNGTDGWAAGRYEECYQWVAKVDAYLNENDPFQRPTTASFSGDKGEYRARLYQMCDMPNIHIYEVSSWSAQYSGNLLRSSMYNFSWAALRFWDSFAQPALFGEAGYTATYYQPKTAGYTQIFHNALWGSLSNGLAITPVWWAMDILTENEYQHYAPLRKFIESLNLLEECRTHYASSTDVYDLQGMHRDTTAFGWLRKNDGTPIHGVPFKLQGVLDPKFTNYAIRYFDPWSGEFLAARIRPYHEGVFYDVAPELASQAADVAFYIQPAQGGVTPSQLNLLLFENSFVSVGDKQSEFYCYLLDEQGRFCNTAYNTIHLEITGVGAIDGPGDVTAVNGMIKAVLHIGHEAGTGRIIAQAAGLKPDTLSFFVRSFLSVDDFEIYATDASLQTNWQNQAGTAMKAFVANGLVSGNGQQAMRLEYSLGGSAKTYAWILKELNNPDYRFARGLDFWFKGDQSNRRLQIRLRDKKKNYMDYYVDLNSVVLQHYSISLKSFTMKPGVDSLEWANLADISFRIDQGAMSAGSGSLYFDEIQFLTVDPATAVHESHNRASPDEFQLLQNHPNPFNGETTISYQLDLPGFVQLCVYTLLGQKIATLVDGRQPAGFHHCHWQTNSLASGVYYYRLTTPQLNQTRKCVLLR